MSDIEVYEFEHDFGEGDQMINFVMLDDFNNLQAQLKEAVQTINEQKEEIEAIEAEVRAAFSYHLHSKFSMSMQHLVKAIDIFKALEVKALNKGDSDGDK